MKIDEFLQDCDGFLGIFIKDSGSPRSALTMHDHDPKLETLSQSMCDISKTRSFGDIGVCVRPWVQLCCGAWEKSRAFCKAGLWKC